MKEYRLLSWPEMPEALARTAHRRMLSNLSLRYMTVSQLASVGGMPEHKVLRMIEALRDRGLLAIRDLGDDDFVITQSDEPPDAWWRRALNAVVRRDD